MQVFQLKSGIVSQSSAIPVKPGTYILVMELHLRKTINIGKLGQLGFDAGIYCYLGSAFGPGGLRARTGRHQKTIKKQRWHIDYLRRHCSLKQIWYSVSPENQECLWSDIFRKSPQMSAPHLKFGSSDCKCPSHLFYCSQIPDSGQMVGLLLGGQQGESAKQIQD